ncbi:Endonuclease/exonuclease/phosphatase, partial [Lyophyllum atratum]
LRIWQQNVHKSDIAQAAVLNSARPEDWDVIALQESFLDRLGNTKASPFWIVRYPYHHRRDGSNRSRSVLLINTNIASDSYTVLDIPSTDITAVRFNGDFGHLSLFNVYNDCTHNDSLTCLSTFLSSSLHLARPSARDHMLWLGDFNRHHPLWETVDNRHLNSSDEAIRPLLSLIRDYEMELTLPPGLPTLQTALDRWTRPDNVWCSHSDTNPIISCDVVAHLRPPITDHLPVITVVELPLPRTSSPPSRHFQAAEWKEFNESLKEKLLLRSPARLITTKADFDAKVTLLTSIIQEVISDDEIVPLKKPCPFSKRWWNSDLKELKKARGRASNEARKYFDIRDHPSKAEYTRLSREMADKI